MSTSQLFMSNQNQINGDMYLPRSTTPADMASRGISPADTDSPIRWVHESKFLLQVKQPDLPLPVCSTHPAPRRHSHPPHSLKLKRTRLPAIHSHFCRLKAVFVETLSVTLFVYRAQSAHIVV